MTERDPALVERVLVGDEPINELHIEIDDRCFKLLALHQPMAADLRAIVAAVKINTDLERVGDLAVNIAEAAKRYLQHPPVKPLIDIPRMADIAQAHAARRARRLRPPRHRTRRGRARRGRHARRAQDADLPRAAHLHAVGPATIEPALDLILISRHLERIGDHATNIAEDVIFMVSARDVRHHIADHPSQS